mgnify:CR=1 FL=1
MKKEYYLYILAILLNSLLFALQLSYQQPFNVDGILYLRAATVFLQHGFTASLKIYSWPLYSTLIALIKQITHLTLLQAAYILNFIFINIILIFTIKISQQLKFNLKLQFFSILVLFSLSYYSHYMHHLLRGYGYYSMNLIALYYFLIASDKRSLLACMLFFVFSCLGFLFRVEGIFYIVLLPLTVLFFTNYSYQQKIQLVLKFYLLPILILIVGIIILLIDKNIHNYLGRFNNIIKDLLKPTIIWHNFIILEEKFAQLLTYKSLSDSRFIIFVSIPILVLKYFIVSFGSYGSYFIILCYSFITFKKQQIKIQYNHYIILLSYALINWLFASLFFYKSLFLVDRYLAFAFFILLFPLIPAIEYAYITHKNSFKNQLLFYLLLLLLLYNFVAAIGHFGPSKKYQILAGKWITNNLQPISQVYFDKNSLQIKYFASANLLSQNYPKGENPYERLRNANLTHYNYIIILIMKHKYDTTLQTYKKLLFNFHIIKIFHNKRDDKVIIFANNIIN